MAIHDRRLMNACSLIGDLSPNSLKKKRPQESNMVFLNAMANRLDTACVMLLEKGFPENINAPIHGGKFKETDKLVLPSYFMLAIAFGSDALVKAMIKVSIV